MGLFHKKLTFIDADTGVHINEKQPTKFANALASTFATTAKQLVWIYTINGIAWIWCSYILAFTGHEQIAETLSGNVCSVVIGQIGFYLVTKTIENIFKYNNIIGPWRVGIKHKEDHNNVGQLYGSYEPVTGFGDPVPGVGCDTGGNDPGDSGIACG